MACASTAGFHHGSSRNTYSAAVRFNPSPPALRLIRNSLQSGSVWKRSTRAQRIVELALLAFELTVDRLLDPLGQVLRHLALRAPQDEGAQAAGEHRARPAPV